MMMMMVTILFHLLSTYCVPGPVLSISVLLDTHSVLPIENREAGVNFPLCYRGDAGHMHIGREAAVVGFEPRLVRLSNPLE